VYTDEGSIPIGNGRTVSVAINGGTVSGTDLFSDDTDTNGVYEVHIPSDNLNAGDRIIAFIDGETQKGAAVTVTDGNNLTGLDIYKDSIIARHDNAGIMTNSIMGESAGGGAHNGDADIPYSCTGSAITTDDGTVSLRERASHRTILSRSGAPLLLTSNCSAHSPPQVLYT